MPSYTEIKKKKKKQWGFFGFLDNFGGNQNSGEPRTFLGDLIYAFMQFFKGFMKMIGGDNNKLFGAEETVSPELEARIPVALRGDIKTFENSLEGDLKKEFQSILSKALDIEDEQERKIVLLSQIANFHLEKIKGNGAVSQSTQSKGEQLYDDIRKQLKDMLNAPAKRNALQHLFSDVDLDKLHEELGFVDDEFQAGWGLDQATVAGLGMNVSRPLVGKALKVLEHFKTDGHFDEDIIKQQAKLTALREKQRELELATRKNTKGYRRNVESLQRQVQLADARLAKLNDLKEKSEEERTHYKNDLNTFLNGANKQRDHHVALRAVWNNTRNATAKKNKKTLKNLALEAWSLSEELDRLIEESKTRARQLRGPVIDPNWNRIKDNTGGDAVNYVNAALAENQNALRAEVSKLQALMKLKADGGVGPANVSFDAKRQLISDLTKPQIEALPVDGPNVFNDPNGTGYLKNAYDNHFNTNIGRIHAEDVYNNAQRFLGTRVNTEIQNAKNAVQEMQEALSRVINAYRPRQGLRI